MAVDLHHDDGFARSERDWLPKANPTWADGMQVVNALSYDKLQFDAGGMSVAGRI